MCQKENRKNRSISRIANWRCLPQSRAENAARKSPLSLVFQNARSKLILPASTTNWAWTRAPRQLPSRHKWGYCQTNNEDLCNVRGSSQMRTPIEQHRVTSQDHKIELLLLALVLLAAFVIRIYRLGEFPDTFLADEADNAQDAIRIRYG